MTMQCSRMLVTAAVGVLAGAAAGCAQPPVEPPPPSASAAQPATLPPVASPTGEFATADDLLTALERADENLVSLTAGVRYDRTQELQGDRQIRMGTLYFVSGKADPAAPVMPDSSGAPSRKFAVKFDQLRVGDVVRNETKTFIFDGEWLVEKYPQEKPPLFLKKQVVPPGQKFDPLKIGEGPFPLPIGQRAADIKSRFSVELLPPATGLETPTDATPSEQGDAEQLRQFVDGSSELRLIPKPGASPDDQVNFKEIRLWYRRDKTGGLLPRMARTVDKAGDISVVQLINVAVQVAGAPPNSAAKVPPDMLDTTEPARESGWDVTITPWQKSTSAGAESTGRKEPADAGDP